MPSNPDSQISFRDTEISDYYDAEFGRGARHVSAKRDVGRYRSLLHLVLPKLSKSDAIALWNSVNGANTSHAEMLLVLQQSVASELLEDGLRGLAQTVKKWTPCEWFAVVDACDRVGAGANHVENIVMELERVGLC